MNYSTRTGMVAIAAGASIAIVNLACAMSVSTPEAKAQPASGSAAFVAAPADTRIAQGSETTAAPSAADRQFVDTVGAAGLAEVQEASLAKEKASSADVKRGAGELKKDHEAANAELKRIATSFGMELPAEQTPERKELFERLKKLSGAEFDKEYLRAGEAAHAKTIALFEKTARETGNADIKRFATNTLPTLKKHLNMMKELKAKQA